MKTSAARESHPLRRGHRSHGSTLDRGSIEIAGVFSDEFNRVVAGFRRDVTGEIEIRRQRANAHFSLAIQIRNVLNEQIPR